MKTHYLIITEFKNVRVFEGPLRNAFPADIGSGYCVFNGTRDVSWRRETLEGANSLRDKIKALAKKLKVRARVVVAPIKE